MDGYMANKKYPIRFHCVARALLYGEKVEKRDQQNKIERNIQEIPEGESTFCTCWSGIGQLESGNF
jgi:hypothetical protein